MNQSYVFSDNYYDNQFNRCPDAICKYVNFDDKNINTIIDFGCGHGIKALSIALRNPDKEVVGVDITDAFKKAKEFASSQLGIDLPGNLSFRKIMPGQSLRDFASPNLIYSWSVLEHIQKNLLEKIIHDMNESLSPNGLVFTQIAPLYYSPYGSHLREYIKQPWGHLSMDYHTIKQITENGFGDILEETDKNKRKWMFDNYTRLNKITAEELTDYFVNAGFGFKGRKIINTSIKPPRSLLYIYNESALTNNEIIFVNNKLADT